MTITGLFSIREVIPLLTLHHTKYNQTPTTNRTTRIQTHLFHMYDNPEHAQHPLGHH